MTDTFDFDAIFPPGNDEEAWIISDRRGGWTIQKCSVVNGDTLSGERQVFALNGDLTPLQDALTKRGLIRVSAGEFGEFWLIPDRVDHIRMLVENEFGPETWQAN